MNEEITHYQLGIEFQNPSAEGRVVYFSVESWVTIVHNLRTSLVHFSGPYMPAAVTVPTFIGYYRTSRSGGVEGSYGLVSGL